MGDAMNQSIKELKAQIKNGSFERVYLFFGEENYLAEEYEKKLRAAVVDPGAEMMNLDIFEGKSLSVGAVIDAAQTAGFMSDFRMVIVRDSMLFAAGRKDDSERMSAFIKEIPDTTVLLFVENQVDKRGKIYKELVKTGKAIEFVSPSEKELVDWSVRLFGERGGEISAKTASLLIRVAAADMRQIVNETEKLISYAGGRKIKDSDIDEVCTKSLETKIFDLVGAVGNRDAQTALDIFSNLLLMKESPIMVITMLARQFRLILQCKALSETGASAGDMAAVTGLRSFMLSQYQRQGNNFTTEALVEALKSCLDADLAIKTGRMNDRLAVEMLILRYSKAI